MWLQTMILVDVDGKKSSYTKPFCPENAVRLKVSGY